MVSIGCNEIHHELLGNYKTDSNKAELFSGIFTASNCKIKISVNNRHDEKWSRLRLNEKICCESAHLVSILGKETTSSANCKWLPADGDTHNVVRCACVSVNLAYSRRPHCTVSHTWELPHRQLCNRFITEFPLIQHHIHILHVISTNHT